MHPLFRFALDLFESNQPLAPENKASPAIEVIAPEPPLRSEPVVATGRLADVMALVTFRHPRANREARLCEAVVAYEFKRGKRRTIGFSVGPDGLVVSAPKWVPLHEVDSALQEKSGWIIRKLGETRERHQRLTANRIEWRDGTTVPFLGEPVTVLLDPRHGFGAAGAELRTAEAGLTLLVGLSHAASPEQIRDAVQAWLMRQAKRVFTERLDHFAPQLQVQWRKLSLSNAGTRWGSARIDGSIRLNWRLIHFRQPVIDYVVAHELSHLRVMDHSPRFWDTVRSVMPDYAELRGQLKDEAAPRWG
jgi:predicted metal-dependent hydrolase